MPNQVSMGAIMKCSFGAAPSTLTVLPKNKILAEGPPAANIMDHIPMVNIMSFGMCSSPGNPLVAATGTPKPCVPVTPAPWIAGATTVLYANMPALDNVSKCMCTLGGVIEFVNPFTTKTMIP